MKKIIKNSIKQLISDRYLLSLVVLMILLALLASILLGMSIHSGERQLVSHYSAFGITHFYFDKWYYSFVFIAFLLIVAVLHSIVSIKLLLTKGRPMAIMFAWFGVGLIIVGFATASTILGLQTLL
ncbi:MAG: hypothetical protein NTV39_03845 [Candidatus Saccharibacteria bacterium]|nr:hypothetical protein [Candidatus Saccharibacteria bacterium]